MDENKEKSGREDTLILNWLSGRNELRIGRDIRGGVLVYDRDGSRWFGSLREYARHEIGKQEKWC